MTREVVPMHWLLRHGKMDLCDWADALAHQKVRGSAYKANGTVKSNRVHGEIGP